MTILSTVRSKLQGAGGWISQSPRFVVGGLIVAMVILGLLIARNSMSQSVARGSAQAEGDALLEINRLAMTLLDLETGQRGYILTRDATYLAPYQGARREVDAQFESVKLVLSGTGSIDDEVHVTQLGGLIHSKLLEMDRTVALGRAGEFELAAQMVQRNLGKRDMDAMRRHLSALAARQNARRSEAFAHAENVERGQLPLILLMWLLIVLFGWAALVSERRRARSAAQAEQAQALSEANERATLLTEELNHRVKNLFAVVLSVINLSGRKQASAKVVVDDISARIHALMQAHNAALERGGTDADLRTVIDRTLRPYCDEADSRVRIDGPDFVLSSARVTSMAMILHELATNAAKYGALADPGGRLEIVWTRLENPASPATVTLTWREDCARAIAAPQSEADNGFGTRMTTMAAKQLGGEIERTWTARGIVVELAFPVR